MKHNIFWSGGFDSTFLVCKRLIVDELPIETYYLNFPCDGYNINYNKFLSTNFDESMKKNELNILENEVMFEVQKEGGTPSKFIMADTSMDIKFNLADPQVIPNVPAINKTEGNVEIELDEEFTTKFIKAKDAVGEEVFYISTQDGFTSKEVAFTIGNKSTNSVSFSRGIEDGGEDIKLDNIPFNSDLVKEIFKHNKRFELGFIQINPKGLMTFAFKFGDLETNYYLVRNQNQ